MTAPAERIIPGPAAPIGPGGRPPIAANGHGGLPGGWPEPPPGVPRTRSTYLDLLPGIYHDNDFLGRFLLIFEHILSPIERTVGNLSHYLDPGLTPPDFLPWLGSWLGLVVDARIPEERRRELVSAAPELYRWRGTKRGLREYLRIYTGIEPEIIEPTLSEIAANRALAFRFTVRMTLPAGSPIQRSYIESIIEAEKPAFAACALELRQA